MIHTQGSKVKPHTSFLMLYYKRPNGLANS